MKLFKVKQGSVCRAMQGSAAGARTLGMTALLERRVASTDKVFDIEELVEDSYFAAFRMRHSSSIQSQLTRDLADMMTGLGAKRAFFVFERGGWVAAYDAKDVVVVE